MYELLTLGSNDSKDLELFCLPHVFISLTVFHFMSDRKIRRYYEYLNWITDVFDDIVKGKLTE